MRKLTAFTLIELLITIALIALISGPLVLVAANVRANHTLASETEKLAGMLTQARIYARESKDETAWGIKISNPNTYILLKNPTTNVFVNEYPLPAPIVVTSSIPTIWFNQVTGDLKGNVEANLVLTGAMGKTKTIAVSVNGVVDVE